VSWVSKRLIKNIFKVKIRFSETFGPRLKNKTKDKRHRLVGKGSTKRRKQRKKAPDWKVSWDAHQASYKGGSYE